MKVDFPPGLTSLLQGTFLYSDDEGTKPEKSQARIRFIKTHKRIYWSCTISEYVVRLKLEILRAVGWAPVYLKRTNGKRKMVTADM